MRGHKHRAPVSRVDRQQVTRAKGGCYGEFVVVLVFEFELVVGEEVGVGVVVGVGAGVETFFLVLVSNLLF